MVDRHSDSGWLLHIGAGRSSVRVLQRARERGLRTVAIDIDPNAPGMAHATKTIECDRNDLDGLVRAVREFTTNHPLCGCITTSSAESALDAAAAVRAEHNLRGLRADALTSLSDRSAWKNRLSTNSIQTPASALISNSQELDEFLADEPSALIKPESGGRGSMGVARVRQRELRTSDLFVEAREASTSELVLAETFIPGDEYSIDGIICDGDFQLLHLGRKFSAPNFRGTLPTGYAWGAPRKDARSEEDPRWYEYQTLAADVGRALDLDDTFMSLDVIDNGEATFVVDVGCQLDAKVDLGLEFSGLNVADLECAVAIGSGCRPSCDPAGLRRGYAIRFFYADSDGCLRFSTDSEDRRFDTSSHSWNTVAMPAFRTQIEWEKEPNALVNRPRSVSDLVVCALVEAEDRNHAWMRCNEIDRSTLFAVEETAQDIEADMNDWSPQGSKSS